MKMINDFRSMKDSAFPTKAGPKTDIVLIYVGGDTPHPWTDDDIKSQPERYRFPTWVRSNPAEHDGAAEAALFAAWLHSHKVPQGVCVCLDLETAISNIYVQRFNSAMRAAGYKVVKYGSKGNIFKNPKTDGGTFVADPQSDKKPFMGTTGDTVATQYAFDGAYDLSLVKDNIIVPLWDIHGPDGPPYRHVADGTKSLDEIAHNRHTTAQVIINQTLDSKTPINAEHRDAFNKYIAPATGRHMPKGLVYYTHNP
jgi:hypothetical protein